jgi:hypothetical protein
MYDRLGVVARTLDVMSTSLGLWGGLERIFQAHGCNAVSIQGDVGEFGMLKTAIRLCNWLIGGVP